MTVLPRRVDTGAPRRNPDRKPKHAVSVRKAMGDRIAAAARERGCSMADIVREACADILEPERVR